MSEPQPHGAPQQEPEPEPEPEPDASSGDWLGELEAELTAEGPPRVTGGRIGAAVASLALVFALLFWALPWATGASWSGIATSFAALPAWSVPAVIILGVLALLLEALTVRNALPPSRPAMVLQGHAASQALALAVPGGGVLGMGLLGWILRRSGLGLAVIITGLIAASLVEMAVTSVVVPLLGLAAYTVSDLLAGPELDLPGTLGAAIAAVIGSAIALGLTAIALNRRVLLGLLDHLSGFVTVPTEAVLAQRDALLRLLSEKWAPLLLPTVLARTLQWAALLLCVHAVGAQIPVLLTIAIFALGRVLSLVPLTPGGAGITETVSAAALVALGVGADQAAAAVLLLAVATLVVPLVVGAVAAAGAFLWPPLPSPTVR